MKKKATVSIDSRWWFTATLLIVIPATAAVVVILNKLPTSDLAVVTIILLVLLAVVVVGGLFIGLIAALAAVIRRLLADDQRGDLMEMAMMGKIFQPPRVTNQYRQPQIQPPMQAQFPQHMMGPYRMTDLMEEEEKARPPEIDLE